MFSAILADDEINILNLLEGLIDWNALNIKIAAKCMTGTETYQRILTETPDIVIIDIKMPGLSGLEVVRKIQEQNIFPNFILISGHKEFEYARSAIQYSVENYLVKPINKEELTENLQQIIQRMEKERSSKNYEKMLENQIETNLAISRTHFLKMLFLSPDLQEQKSLEELNQIYGLELFSGFFRVISIKPDTKKLFTLPQYQILLKQIYEYACQKFHASSQKAYGIIDNNEIIFLMNYTSEEELAVFLISVFELLKNKFYSYCYVTLGISSRREQLFQVSFQEAHAAVISRIFLGKHRIIDYSGLSQFKSKLNLSTYLEQIGTYIDTLNLSGVEKLFLHLQEDFSNDTISPSSVIDLCAKFLELLKDQIRNQYQKAGIDYDFPKKQYQAQIQNASSKEDLISTLKHMIIGEISAFQKLQYTKDSRYISQAKEYIHDHLDQNITLNEVAEMLYINPSYFSTLFKKETGETFSNYITQTRIGRSKELLRDLKYSISEVSAMVGYQDSKYFSKVFQKTVGIKPSKFRKLYTN